MEGLDTHVPMILRDGALYDPDLDRFFLDLPLSGVPSRHSLRAYAYDVAVWVRFLAAACGKHVWAAGREDVAGFHRARRREDAGTRISAASWNRAVAALEKLYRWGEAEGLVAQTPFTHRAIWRRGHAGGRGRMTGRNDAYERAAKRADVRFATLEDYRLFRDVGLRGLTLDGGERPGARDRNGARNALFASCWSRPGCGSRRRPRCSLPSLPAWLPLRRPIGRSGWSCRRASPRASAAGAFSYPAGLCSSCCPIWRSSAPAPSLSSRRDPAGAPSSGRSSPARSIRDPACGCATADRSRWTR